MVSLSSFLRVSVVVLVTAGVAEARQPQSTAGRQADALEQVRALATAGKHQEALARLAPAAVAFGRVRDDRSLAETELLRATSLRAIAERAPAADAARRARALGASLDNPAIQVRALILLARLANEGGDTDGFAARLGEARPIAEASGDSRLVARVLNGLGESARSHGRHLEAIDFHTREIAAADASGDTEHSIRGRSARATTLLGLGRYDEALADGEEAHRRAAAAPVNLRASVAFALAQIQAHLWNLDSAADLWEEAIALYREAGLAIGVSLSLRQSMETWFALGELARAAAAGTQALAMFERTGSAGTAPDTLARLALIEARRGDIPAAAAYADRARGAAGTIAPRRQVFIQNDLGLVALLTGEPARAAAAFRQVRELAQSQNDVEYTWRGDYGIGRAALARGDAPTAQHHLQQASDALEHMRLALPEPGQRATFMIQRGMVQEALVEVLLARSAAPDDWFARRAFDVAEGGHARALADQMAETRARADEPAIDAVRQTEAAFSRRLSGIQKALMSADDEGDRARLTRELGDAEREFESLVARLRRDNPSYAALAWPRPLSAEDVMQMLDPSEALVAFLVGETSSWGWAFRGGRMRAFRLPSRAELEAQVREIRGAVSSGKVEALDRAGRTLAAALLEPAADLLAGAARVIFVPDGPLHRLPFSALPAGNGWLIERHAVSVAPSVTVLAELRRRTSTARRMLLALAAPKGQGPARDLPNAAGEARLAARIAGGQSAVRDRAREEDVKRADIGEYRILHFATHAVIDERIPRRSAVLLQASEEEDGLLQVNEIAHLPLTADLVVLAACRTQMGRALRGEGLLNLSRAFLQAGARAVVATLWDVNDADTRRLMERFYGHVRGGTAPDEALRRAQIELLREPGSAARSAGWAGFLVVGDASRPVVTSTWRAQPTLGLVAAVVGALVMAFAAFTVMSRRRA